MAQFSSWLSVTEAARTSQFSERAIRKACENGKLKAMRKSSGWLIDSDEFKQWDEDCEAHKPGRRSMRPNVQRREVELGSTNRVLPERIRYVNTVNFATHEKTARIESDKLKGKDTVSKEKRSRIMGSVGTRNTKPELALRSLLHRNGYRFRLHDKSLPGSPDIVLSKYRTAIFVHGCFWHRHEGCKKTTTPAQNAEFWEAKFTRNKDRDRQNAEELRNSGWNVLTIWECEILEHAEETMTNIRKCLSEITV